MAKVIIRSMLLLLVVGAVLVRGNLKAQTPTISSSSPSCYAPPTSGLVVCTTQYICTNSYSNQVTESIHDVCPNNPVYNEASSNATVGSTLAAATADSAVGVYPLPGGWPLRTKIETGPCAGTPVETITVLGTCNGPNEGCPE